ncbi:MAG: class I SAM-dependent methyltransferase [Chloroflexota bacterium]
MTAADRERAADLARWYDLDLRDDPGDLDLYRALLGRSEGAVLELAAGSGRLAVPLALAGHRVVALDLDPAMLGRSEAAWAARRGRRPAERLRHVEADIVAARLGERFPLVFIGLNSLLLLDRDAQAACFRTMAAHLAPGGLAVVDVLLPDADDLALYDGRLQLEWVRTDPVTGEQVTKIASARHDAATATVDLVQIFEATPPAGGPVRRRLRQDRLHLVSARELVLLAEAAGLAVEGVMGDYQLSPLEPGAERAILLARLVE